MQLRLAIGLLALLQSSLAPDAPTPASPVCQTPIPAPAKSLQAPPGQPDQHQVFTFDFLPLNQLPPGWKQGSTGEGSAEWKVLADDQNHVLAQTRSENPNRHFSVCWLEGFQARNLSLQVRLRAIAGQLDQGGGLIWRARDERNYYVVRANPLEKNVVLYRMENGRRTDLPLVGQGRTYGTQANTSTHRWHLLAVDVQDDTFSVSLDDQSLFQVRDATFTQPGAVGLWTKADAVTWFDDLQVVVHP